MFLQLFPPCCEFSVAVSHFTRAEARPQVNDCVNGHDERDLVRDDELVYHKFIIKMDMLPWIVKSSVLLNDSSCSISIQL